MIKRLLFGLLKGLLVGGAFGALMHFALGTPILSGGLGTYAFYGGVGAASGAIAGRAPWKPGVWVAAILKGVFGIAIGCGLFALAAAFFNINLPALLGNDAGGLAMRPMLFAPLLAMVYASLVELDDGSDDAEPAVVSKVRANLEDIDVGEDEEVPAAQQTPAAKKKSS